MVFEALQNKERKRNTLVSKSFTFYYSYLCFPFVISRLHSLLLLLCGDMRLSHSQGHRYRPTREKRDIAQHPAHAWTGGVYRQVDGVCQEWRCHAFGTSTTEWEWGKGKDAHCNWLRAQKILEIYIFQIINEMTTNKEEKGYDLETSGLLFLSLFCNASKNTWFIAANIMFF